MNLPPFLLDRWIEHKAAPDSPIEYDLASSTGPVWTLEQLLAFSGGGVSRELLETRLLYTAAAGGLELRKTIAAHQGVEPDDIQVVTGASEALLILFFLAAEPGANVVLPNPGFPANAALAESFGIEVRYYAVKAENEFRVDPDEIARLADRNTRLLLVNSPHNPTGSVLGEDEMQTLHDFCRERSIQFVSDEVYHPIYHGPEMRSAARLPHATAISDFSKALCLSGLRVGWIVDRDPVRRERYRDARNYFTITCNVLGEKLAALALEHCDALYEHARRVSAQNLALLDRVLAEHKAFLHWMRPSGGMTAFPWFADGRDTRDFCRRLAQRGVLVVPGDCFGEPAHFRLGFAASGAGFPEAMDRFAEFLREEGKTVG